MRNNQFFRKKNDEMVKIGNKVRFLNSTGGGRVKAFHGKNMVMVEDESGFDFPVLMSECVVVDGGDSDLRSSQPPRADIAEVKPVAQPKPAEVKPVITETPGGERLSVSIAFLPVDRKAITQSGYEAWFINDSNYFLYFTCLSRQNNSWTSRYHGLIEPNTKIFMEEFGKEALNDLEHICVQMIAFKQNKPFRLKNAHSVELRVDTVKFYKVHCFTDNEYFDEDALIFPVVQHDVPERQLLVSATELQEAMLQKKQDTHRTPRPVKKTSKTENPVVEFDLHINQLLDSTDGMSTGDLLNYQLHKFHEVLKQYAGKKGQKIVFIHGKGEGVLRAAIEKELKTRYKSYVFQDASFQEYGFGATLVKIR